MTGDLTPGVFLVVVAGAIRAPRWIRLAIGALGAVVLVGVPTVAVCVAVGVGWMAWRRAVSNARLARAASESQLLVVDLMALGVDGGLSFTQAAEFAAGAVGDPVRSDLAARIRRLRAAASSAAGARPASRDGPIDEAFAVASRSRASGSALGPALTGVAEAARRELGAAERRRLARLPTKLLFPLAFLILPGFVLMTVGPAVVSGLSRLSL